MKKELKTPISLSIRQDVYKKIDKFLGENPKGKWDLSITERKKKRSIPANKAYQDHINQQPDRN